MGMQSRIGRISLGLAAWGAWTLMAQPADSGKGKTVFAAQCSVCHSADSVAKKLGPGLKGLFKKKKLESGKQMTEANVRAVIDAGGNGMPEFKELLSTAEKDNLLAYLKAL
jgi:cytochrome c